MTMEEKIEHRPIQKVFARYPVVDKWFQYIKRNHVKSLVLAFLLFVLLQILFLPYGSIGQLKSKNPGETAFMREQAENAKKEKRPFHIIQYWIPLRSISQDAVDAVIVSEDGTFWSHHGFDWFEFRESVERNFEEGRAVRGARYYYSAAGEEFVSFVIKKSAAKIKRMDIDVVYGATVEQIANSGTLFECH